MADRPAQIAGTDSVDGQPARRSEPDGRLHVTVQICGDTTIEANETLRARHGRRQPIVHDGRSATGRAAGMRTINKDDGRASSRHQPELWDGHYLEFDDGQSGTTAFTFTVTKAGGTRRSLRAVLHLGRQRGRSERRTAATPLTTLTFAPSGTTKTFNVAVTGNTVVAGTSVRCHLWRRNRRDRDYRRQCHRDHRQYLDRQYRGDRHQNDYGFERRPRRRDVQHRYVHDHQTGADLTNVAPTSGATLQTLDVVLTGTNFIVASAQ